MTPENPPVAEGAKVVVNDLGVAPEGSSLDPIDRMGKADTHLPVSSADDRRGAQTVCDAPPRRSGRGR